MLLEIARENLWVALLLWTVLYVSDYGLTLVGARLRAALVNPHYTTEGSYELNSYFVKDIDRLRVVSLRFLLALILTISLLALIWYVSRGIRFGSGAFEFALGILVLMELAIHVRHLRNIFTFRRQTLQGELRGTVEVSRRYLFWTSALDLALFAGLYLILFVFVGRVFFLGGALACATLALRHWLRVRREPLLSTV